MRKEGKERSKIENFSSASHFWQSEGGLEIAERRKLRKIYQKEEFQIINDNKTRKCVRDSSHRLRKRPRDTGRRKMKTKALWGIIHKQRMVQNML